MGAIIASAQHCLCHPQSQHFQTTVLFCQMLFIYYLFNPSIVMGDRLKNIITPFYRGGGKESKVKDVEEFTSHRAS